MMCGGGDVQMLFCHVSVCTCESVLIRSIRAPALFHLRSRGQGRFVVLEVRDTTHLCPENC